MSVEEVNAEYDNKTSTLTLKAKNIQCLENKLKTTYLTPKVQKSRKVINDFITQVDLAKLMPDRHNCVEYQVKLEVKSVNRSVVWSQVLNSTMTVGLPRYEDGKLEFEIIEDVYKNCKERANLYLSCNSEVGNITTLENEGLSLEQSKVEGMFCRAKTFITTLNSNDPGEDLNFKNFSVCFTDTGTPCAHAKWNTVLIGCLAGGVVFFLLLGCSFLPAE